MTAADPDAMNPWEVDLIDAHETHDLRRAVLRGGDPDANVAWPEDERPSAFHLGCRGAQGVVVATASFSQEAIAARPGAPAWRLRGMAVAEAQQGRGIGHAIIELAVVRIRAQGGAVLWCNARDTAMAFYAREGFVVVGDGFNTDETGLAHHRMLRDL